MGKIKIAIKMFPLVWMLFLFSSCWMIPYWHRNYQSHEFDTELVTNNIRKWEINIENSIYFDKYSVNNTTFIVDSSPNIYSSSFTKRNTVTGSFRLLIFKKPKEFVTYRLLKATINTLSYSSEIIKFINSIEVVFDPSETTNRQDGYNVELIMSDYYYFPCPKDMKYSITVMIEEENKNGIKTEYEFTYNFYLEKWDRWFMWIGP